MAKAAAVKVVTEVGTFTRTTARSYSHIVVVGPVRAAYLERRRQEQMAAAADDAVRYAKIAETGVNPRMSKSPSEHDVLCHEKFLSDGSYMLWSRQAEASLASLTEKGEITASEGAPAAYGWCGRLELARRQRASVAAQGIYEWVRVFDVATGLEVL